MGLLTGGKVATTDEEASISGDNITSSCRFCSNTTKINLPRLVTKKQFLLQNECVRQTNAMPNHNEIQQRYYPTLHACQNQPFFPKKKHTT